MLYSDKNEQKWNACWELSLIETRLLNCSKIPADVRGTQSFQFHDKWRYGFWVIAYLVTEAMWKYLFTCADNNNNKALYLYPIHAGLHLQLLHSFPGLGDAGRAVVGDAVLHGAPVTPNRCKGGGGDSVNVTLNQHPPGDSYSTTTSPPPVPFYTVKLGRTHFVCPFVIWRSCSVGISWTAVCHFSASAHAWLLFFLCHVII